MKRFKTTLIHKSNCATSLRALRTLKSEGVVPEIREYLVKPLSAKELTKILQKLKMQPEQLVRKKEKVFRENFSGKQFSNEEWLQMLVDYPILLDRPIVIKNRKAAIVKKEEEIMEWVRVNEG